MVGVTSQVLSAWRVIAKITLRFPFSSGSVARKNLDEAWNLTTPNLRGGLTHKQWMTGNIPVVPMGVPIDKAAITRIISSTKNEAQINVVVLPKPNKQKVQATLYVVIVKKIGGRWLVDYALPQASPGAPAPS